MRTIPAAAAVCCIAIATGDAAADDGFEPLFNGKDLSGWVPVNVAPDTFTVADGMIVCSGKPTGVMRTERQYENFIVEFEWRHMVPGGNAGFFLWSDPLPAVGAPFTRSIEVQVLDGHDAEWYTSHGDVFPIWGATLRPDNNRGRGSRAFPTEMRCRPSPQWNHYRIECRGGAVSLAVNGKVVTTARSASPRKGYLCIESEGGVVHYRNLRIRELPPSDPPLPPEHIAHLDEGYRSLYTGVDLSGWKVAPEAAQHWTVSDWTLAYDGQGDPEHATLWTDQPLGDCRLILDFQTRDAADLRILMKGRSDAPMVLNLAPQTPGLRKPGEWNRLRITLRSGGLEAEVNGQRLPVTAEESLGTGPLGLQPRGAASFANLFVKSLE